MGHVTLDKNAIAQLRIAADTVQVRDDSGQVVGYFHPSKPPLISSDCPYSEEELDRHEAIPGGRPLADILADFRKQG